MSENGGPNYHSGAPHVRPIGEIVDACDSAAPRKLTVALPGGAADDLRCLFFHGPTWDGNVPSKQGRDELVRMGLAARGNGWQWLTSAGIQACFDNGIHHEKESREGRERKRRNEVNRLAEAVLGINRQSPHEPPVGTIESVLGAGQPARQDER